MIHGKGTWGGRPLRPGCRENAAESVEDPGSPRVEPGRPSVMEM